MKTHVITPSELFEAIEVKDRDEALKIFEAAFAFLVYMKVGDELQLSNLTLKKISENLLHVESATNGPEVIDFLAKRRILKLPL